MSAAIDWDIRRKEFRDGVATRWRDMGMRGQAPRVLANAEVDGLDQLLQCTKRQLKTLPGMGIQSFWEVENILRENGFVFEGNGRPISRKDWEAVQRLMAMGWRVLAPQY